MMAFLLLYHLPHGRFTLWLFCPLADLHLHLGQFSPCVIHLLACSLLDDSPLLNNICLM